MESLTLLVPTYYGRACANQIETDEMDEMEEFADPHVPVLIYREDGVRIVLGSDDDENLEVPDIKVERRPHGWGIFLHPLGGSDPSGYVYFLDDGRSFLVEEHGYGPTPPIASVDDVSDIPMLDEVPQVSGRYMPRSVDGIPIEEVYELVSEVRSLAFWDDNAKTWNPDRDLGPEFTAAVKNLLKRYRLEPRLTRRTTKALD